MFKLLAISGFVVCAIGALVPFVLVPSIISNVDIVLTGINAFGAGIWLMILVMGE